MSSLRSDGFILGINITRTYRYSISSAISLRIETVTDPTALNEAQIMVRFLGSISID